MKKMLLALCLVPFLFACFPDPIPANPEDPAVYFISPIDGAEVASPVNVELGVVGLTLEPPGVARPGAGYLVIVLNEGCVEPGTLMPFDAPFVHLQDGATETVLTFTTERVKMCLQAADGEHRALPLTDEIEIDAHGT